MGLSCPSISPKSNLNPSILIPPFLLGSIFTQKTPILGLRLFIVIIATVVLVLAAFVLILLLLRQQISKRRCIDVNQSSELLPLVCSEAIGGGEADRREVKSEKNRVFVIGGVSQGLDAESESKESSTTQSESSSAMSASTDGFGSSRWGRWYSLRELQVATNQFSAQNVIGEGGYGIVLSRGFVGWFRDCSEKSPKQQVFKFGWGFHSWIQIDFGDEGREEE